MEDSEAGGRKMSGVERKSPRVQCLELGLSVAEQSIQEKDTKSSQPFQLLHQLAIHRLVV